MPVEELINVVILVFLVSVFVFGPALLRYLMKRSKARPRGQGQQAQIRGPDGRTPSDEIKDFLKAIGVHVDEEKPKPKPPPQPAPKPQPQQQAPSQPQPRERTVYRAEQDEVKAYLESIGVKVESRERPRRPAQRRPAAQRPPQPAAAQRPPARPAQPARRREAKPLVERRAQAPPPKPKAPRRRAPAAPQPPAPPEAPPRRAGRPVLARPGRLELGALGPLGGAPTLAELRRAVILAEVIGRPDFDRLPHERLKL